MKNSLFAVVVTHVRQLTPRIREYVLADPSGLPLPPAQPGSHIELHMVSERHGPIIRHYSIVGGVGLEDDPACSYRIAVQREDRVRGSAYIHETFEVGTELKVSRPRNNFLLAHNDQHSLLLAGGIGITPIYSMLRSLVRRGRSYEFVYSGRTADALAYRAELASLTQGRAHLHESGDPPTAHLDLPTVFASQPAGTTAYVCGPPGMIKATHLAAAQAGWRPEQVRSELFSAGPVGDEVAFTVELAKSKRSVAVGRDTTILDALIAAGVDTLSDCRRGECGLCPMTILEADGQLQHRDHYLDEEARAAGKKLCICVSRIKGERLVLDA